VPAMACLGGLGGVPFDVFNGFRGMPWVALVGAHGLLPMRVPWHARGHYKLRLVACHCLPMWPPVRAAFPR
jgi:hypothetical protein